jgi:hypothetical protein
MNSETEGLFSKSHFLKTNTEILHKETKVPSALIKKR